MIYIDKDFSSYSGAFYQKDFQCAVLKAPHSAYFVEYDKNWDKKAVLEICREQIIILGYHVLEDLVCKKNKSDLDFIKRIVDISNFSILVLNKEYIDLNIKIAAVNFINPDLIFTHHHSLRSLTAEKIYSDVYFSPFGFNPDRFFNNHSVDRDIDFTFSGMLFNGNQKNDFRPSDSGFRLAVFDELFHMFMGQPVALKYRYHPIKYSVHVIAASPFERKVWRLFGRSKLPPIEEYRVRLQTSKFILGSLSPASLVSTRFLEAICCGCQPVVLKNPVYDYHGLGDYLMQVSNVAAFGRALINGDTIIDKIDMNSIVSSYSWESVIEKFFSRI